MKKILLPAVLFGGLAGGVVYSLGAPLDARLIAGAVVAAGGVGLGLGIIAFARRYA